MSVATAPNATKETAVMAAQNIFFWNGVGDMKPSSRIAAGIQEKPGDSTARLTVHGGRISSILRPMALSEFARLADR